MVRYGIFCSGQYMCLHAFKKSVTTLAEKSELVGQTVRLENEIGLFFSEFTLLYTEFGRPVVTRGMRPYN